MNEALPLRVVDVDGLPRTYRDLLWPNAVVTGPDGHTVRRPRYFYEIDSWDAALQIQLAPHFALWEFIDVDAHEASLLRSFPRYVPCAVSVLAVHLELFRMQVGVPVRIAANGGYRSPALPARIPPRRACGTAAKVTYWRRYMRRARTSSVMHHRPRLLPRLVPPYGAGPARRRIPHIDFCYIVAAAR